MKCKFLALLSLLAASFVFGQTPPTQIHNLPSATTPLNGSEVYPADQGICPTCTVKVTTGQIASYTLSQPFSVPSTSIVGTIPCTLLPPLLGSITTNGGCSTILSALALSSPDNSVIISGLPGTTAQLSVNATNISQGVLGIAQGGTGSTVATGSGSVVLANAPILVNPALGTPSSVNLTNATSLPLTTGVLGILPVANGGTGVSSVLCSALQGTNMTVTGTWPGCVFSSTGGGGGGNVTFTSPDGSLTITGSPGSSIQASVNASNISIGTVPQTAIGANQCVSSLLAVTFAVTEVNGVPQQAPPIFADGYNAFAGDQVFLTDQGGGYQNGPWIIEPSGTPWQRPPCFQNGSTTQAISGQTMFIGYGTEYVGTTWVLNQFTPGTITIGSTSQQWTNVGGGGGSGGTITPTGAVTGDTAANLFGVYGRDVCTFKASSATPCGDGVHQAIAVTSTAGSNTITVPTTISSSYVGVNVVVGGIGYQGIGGANYGGGFTIVSPGSGMLPMDQIYLAGGTYVSNYVGALQVTTTTVTSATVNSNGTCTGTHAVTVTGTTGNTGVGANYAGSVGVSNTSGIGFTGTATMTAGVLGAITITNGGEYTIPPNTYDAQNESATHEPVIVSGTGVSCSVNPTVWVSMGAYTVSPFVAGEYSVVPSSPTGVGSTTSQIVFNKGDFSTANGSTSSTIAPFGVYANGWPFESGSYPITFYIQANGTGSLPLTNTQTVTGTFTHGSATVTWTPAIAMGNGTDYGANLIATVPGFCNQGSNSCPTLNTSTSCSGVGGSCFYGEPLQTTITGLSTTDNVTTITLGTNAITSLSGVTEWLLYGHDDGATLNNAFQLNAGNGPGLYVTMDPTKVYSIYEPTTLSGSTTTNLNCRGAMIQALAPMNTELYLVHGYWQTANVNVENCQFEGSGIAYSNVTPTTGLVRMSYDYFLNALGTYTTYRSGGTNIALGSDVIGARFDHITVFNSSPLSINTEAAPIEPLGPNYNIFTPYANSTDNRFEDFLGGNAVLAQASDSGGSDIYTNMHLYYVEDGPQLWFGEDFWGSNAQVTQFYSDGVSPGFPGILIDNATTVRIGDWNASGGYAGAPGRYGVEFRGLQSHAGNIVGGGMCNNFPNPANCVINLNGATMTVPPTNQGANYVTMPGITLPASNLAPINLAAGNTNGGATGILPVANGGNGTASIPCSGFAGSNMSVSGSWPSCVFNASITGGGYLVLQSSLPFILPSAGYMDASGNIIIGQQPNASQTVSFSGTSGSVTATFSAATLTGTSAGDVGRVITIANGASAYQTCTITAYSSTTAATCTLGGSISSFGPYIPWLTGPVFTATNTAGANSQVYSAPLPAAYANAWVQFQTTSPIGTAGLYFCQFTSVATGTCYNNTYSLGQPEIPGSLTAFSGLTAGSYVPFTAGHYYPAAAVSIPANALGVNGEMDFNYQISNDSSGGLKQFETQFGSTIVTSLSGNQNTATYGGIQAASLTNSTATNQVTSWTLFGSATAQTPVRSSTNTGNNQTFEILIGAGAGTPTTDYIVLERYSAKLFQQN